MNDEFYIGWEDQAPPAIGRRTRGLIVSVVVFVLALSLLVAFAQRTIGVSVFEWGQVKEFSGILASQPYPHLLVPRPGAIQGPFTHSSYLLVQPFKFGFDPEVASRLAGETVKLRGTLIYRSGQTMIEVAANSIAKAESSGRDASENRLGFSAKLGRQTLVGEIVDSKCYLGVMNPGALIPHRACAIRCISGGIPPVLLVRQADGTALYYLLVSSDGQPVNRRVLPLVAEPVEITGDVERQGDLLILRADPDTYRRWTG